MTSQDNINHPPHYRDGKIEVLEYIEDKKFNFHLGNCIKYLSRAGKKDPSHEKTIEDLRKAEWYLRRWIEILEKGENACRPNEIPPPKPTATPSNGSYRESKTRLEQMIEALGWQGGTYTQVDEFLKEDRIRFLGEHDSFLNLCDIDFRYLLNAIKYIREKRDI